MLRDPTVTNPEHAVVCDSESDTLYRYHYEVGKTTTLGVSVESLHVEFE